MTYRIIINYSKNSQHAGTLTLLGLNDKVLLNKVDVALPISLMEQKEFNLFHTVVHTPVSYDNSLALLDKSHKYKTNYTALQNVWAGVLTLKNKSDIFFTISKESKLRRDKQALVLHPKDFGVLVKIIGNTAQDFHIEGHRGIHLFQSALANGESDIQQTFNEFNQLKDTLALQQQKEQRDKKERENLSPPSTKTSSNASGSSGKQTGKIEPKKLDFNEPISPVVQSKSILVNKQTKEPPKVNTQQSHLDYPKKLDFERQALKTKPSGVQQAKATQKSSSQSYRPSNKPNRDDDSIDLLDALLIYNYPGMAPFIKPNSALAWIIYFQHEANEEAQLKAIQQLPGCENVQSIDFTRTGNDYQVNLYKDDQKQNYLGCVGYDSSSQKYNFSDNNNNTNSINYSDNNIQCSLTSSSKDAPATFNFTPTDNGYTGNYDLTSSGNNFSSSFELTPNFDYKTPNVLDAGSSSPSLSYDSQPTPPAPQPDFTPSTSNDWNDTPKPKDDWVPPPPPPPPPDFNSSDSYNNSASFKM